MLLLRGKPRYREFWALKEVSLEIRKGEALGLPVVSTDFGEMSVRRHTPGVFLSDTAADIPQVMPSHWRILCSSARPTLGRNVSRWPLPTRPTNVEAISGACMLVKREALDSVGGWDEGYFLHCEDLDLCMRFRHEGWKVCFVPQAKIFHAWGACSRSRPLFVEWHKHRGMIRFYGKFFRDDYPKVLSWCICAGVWLRFGAMVGYYSAVRLRQIVGVTR